MTAALDPFDLEGYKDKARYAADDELEPFAVVEGPYGFEVFKAAYATRTWPQLVRFTAFPRTQ